MKIHNFQKLILFQAGKIRTKLPLEKMVPLPDKILLPLFRSRFVSHNAKVKEARKFKKYVACSSLFIGIEYCSDFSLEAGFESVKKTLLQSLKQFLILCSLFLTARCWCQRRGSRSRPTWRSRNCRTNRSPAFWSSPLSRPPMLFNSSE